MTFTKEENRELRSAIKKFQNSGDPADMAATLRVMYRQCEGREPQTPERFRLWCGAFSMRWLGSLPNDTLIDLMVDHGTIECIPYEEATEIAEAQLAEVISGAPDDLRAKMAAAPADVEPRTNE
jgi:hypothetical protein